MTRTGTSPLRALGAFLMLPGAVAYVLPIALFRPPADHAWHAPGWAAVGLGTLLLVWCTFAFFERGRGTLAPWDPPRALVEHGVYRLSRNPMYIGVLIIVLGWHLLFRSPGAFVYLMGLALAFHLRVRFHEEPFLAERYGDAWVAYAARVPRWLF